MTKQLLLTWPVRFWKVLLQFFFKNKEANFPTTVLNFKTHNGLVYVFPTVKLQTQTTIIYIQIKA
jgi:hypothetical protein